MFFVYEKQNERRESRRNDNTKRHKKSEGSGERDNTCAQAGERKTQRILGQNDSVVVRAFHTFPLQCQHQLEMWKNINRKYGKASTIFVKSMTKRTNQLCTNKTGFLFLSKPVTLSAYVDNGTVMQ